MSTLPQPDVGHPAGERPIQHRLIPQLVPEPLWGLTAHQLLTSTAWRRIRSDALEHARSCCSVCQTEHEKGLICHELWEYDDDSVATLVGFAMICRDCNLVHHLGRAGMIGLGREAIARLAAINGTDADETRAIVDWVSAEWRRRSTHSWRVAVAVELVARYPDLAALEGLFSQPGQGRHRIVGRAR